MIEVERNPAGGERDYLAHLNASFGGWGGEERYAWVFERAAGGPLPDRMVLRDGDVVLAGSAVSYRRARVNGSSERLVGIMTGSWTLPAARRRGCFTRVIEESLALCREREAALLLAFVTADNASARRLAEAGSVLIPTEYWVAPAADYATGPPDAERGTEDALAPASANAEHLWRLHEAREGGGLRLTYPDLAAWRGQLLDRPATIEVLAGAAGRAIVEREGDTDRVLAMYPEPGRGADLARALVARALAAGRTHFGFTTGGEAAAAWRAAGIAPRPGFLTALPAADGFAPAWTGTGACLENGDRM